MVKKLPWDLIISKLKGNVLTETENNSFNDWLKQEHNLQLFRQLETVWFGIQNKIENYEPDMEYYWKQLSARINQGTDIPVHKSKTNRLFFRPVFKYIAAASVLLIIAFSTAYYLGLSHSLKPAISESYTSITGKSKVLLPDGSVVWLHSNTNLSYTINRETNSREVVLNGEAFFDVKHDINSSFIVKIGDVAVKVHGTKFNIDAYNAENMVLVSLYEGSVEMKSGINEVYLKPGEEGLAIQSNNNLIVRNGDVEFAKSWTNDQLNFTEKNLREVCKYLSKWYAVEIIIDPIIPENQEYSFTVKNESLEEIARLLSRVNDLNYQFTKNNKLVFTSGK